MENGIRDIMCGWGATGVIVICATVWLTFKLKQLSAAIDTRLDSIESTLEVFGDQDAMDQIRRSSDDVKNGRVLPHEELEILEELSKEESEELYRIGHVTKLPPDWFKVRKEHNGRPVRGPGFTQRELDAIVGKGELKD